MIDLAIIVSVVPERFPLLQRSLVTWQKSIFYSELNAGIYLYIEGTSICDALKYIPVGVGAKLEGSTTKSGSHVKGYNHWLERVQAKVYLLSHPEILFPKNTVKVAFDTAQPNTFAAFKTFWLPEHMTKHLDDYPWQYPEQLEQYEEMYKLDLGEKGDPYWNKDIRGIETWSSTTTYSMEHDTLHKMLPFPDFGSWGADDPWHLLTRKNLGIQNVTIQDPILMHQYHPTLQSKSIEEIVQLAQAEVQKE